MLGLPALPGAALLVGSLWLPESPAHLVATGRLDEAFALLVRLQLAEEAAAPWRQRCTDMEAELERMRNAWQSAQLDAQKAHTTLDVSRHEHAAKTREAIAASEMEALELRAKLQAFEAAAEGGGHERGSRPIRVQMENAELNARQASHVSIPHRCRPAPVVSLPVITHRSAQCSQFDEQMR